MKIYTLHSFILIVIVSLSFVANAKVDTSAFDLYYQDAITGKQTLRNSHTDLPTLEQILENMPYDTAIELAVLQDISGRINELSAEDFEKLKQLKKYHEENTFAKLYPDEIIRAYDTNRELAKIIDEIIAKREPQE